MYLFQEMSSLKLIKTVELSMVMPSSRKVCDTTRQNHLSKKVEKIHKYILTKRAKIFKDVIYQFQNVVREWEET